MTFGDFSVSLTVQDLNTSIEFYEKLGFRPFGDEAQFEASQKRGYAILQKDGVNIGLFQKMFPKNILTFNPWPSKGHTDVREIKQQLIQAGIEMAVDHDPKGEGPAHISFLDPDGNPILIDQFE